MLKLNLNLISCLTIAVLFQINDIKAASSLNGFLKDPRIINGTDASLNDTKHQVSIRRRVDDKLIFGNGHICGGSLISENVVLSAAHCFMDPSIQNTNGSFAPEEDFIVVMGTLDRLKFDNNTLVFDIMKIVKHAENFNTTTIADDIVLVMLNGRVPANHSANKQIALNEGPIKNNTMCQVTGWGINENNTRSEKLKIVDQPYIDINDCRNKTQYGSKVRQGMLCAGVMEGGRGPCTADSGGPLVCRGVQVGIVSWGGAVRCAGPLKPTVYADVAYYKNWILKEVANYNGTLPEFGTVSDGVTNLTCSIFLISFMLIFNFIYSQIK